mgnify:FL=1
MDVIQAMEQPMSRDDLFFAIQRLRQYAVNKKLDMTDAFVRSLASRA